MKDTPFKLLEPYDSSEKDIFFGRDAEIIALYHLLKQTRLVLLYGSSGTGKTSLIQAGLPKVFKVTDWFKVSVRRKDDINKSLQESIKRSLGGEELNGSLTQDLLQLHESRWIPIYLVFDQFEEIFTLGNESERVAFFTQIQEILNAKIPVKIILSMREEYIGHLYDYEPLVPTLFEKRFRIEPMKDTTVTEVIEKMCAVNGVGLEKDTETANEIKNRVKLNSRQAAYLPYLHIYLHYLYEQAAMSNSNKVVFKQADIDAVGALGNVLRRFIDERNEAAQTYLQRFKVSDDFAQTLLDEFATGEGTKKAQSVSGLAETLKTKEATVQAALIYFSDVAKILRADENDVSRYEPVHDVVALQIHELRSAEDKAYKAFMRKLDLDFQRWKADEYSNQRLLPNLDIQKVDIYHLKLAGNKEYKYWEEFIEKSRSYRARTERLKRLRSAALTLITILAIAAAFYANHKTKEANKAKNTAEQAQLNLQKERDKAIKALSKAQENEAQRVSVKVDDILHRAEQLEGRKSDALIIQNMRRDAFNELEKYPQNDILQTRLDSLKNSYDVEK